VVIIRPPQVRLVAQEGRHVATQRGTESRQVKAWSIKGAIMQWMKRGSQGCVQP
jgi:hypothetical protein